AKEGTAGLIQSKGMLLGFSSNGFFEDKEIAMGENDMLVLFTDGIIESRNQNGQPLEAEGLVKLVRELSNTVDPLGVLKSQISSFTNQKFEDDTSLITILAK
ncbi:MAG: SpoIIE family protein phosphatase, partial [Ignavibacteria bacterium]|nr:SpoIIE family protein phosphatase [Ignavibacteria bacterium]